MGNKRKVYHIKMLKHNSACGADFMDSLTLVLLNTNDLSVKDDEEFAYYNVKKVISVSKMH